MDLAVYNTLLLSSDSQTEFDPPTTSLGVKPVRNTSIHHTLSTEKQQLSASKASTSTSMESPSSSTGPTPGRQTYVVEPIDFTGHKLEEVDLSPPDTSPNMDTDDEDWDITETREEISAEDGSEDWEEIESQVFDHATNTYKRIPSAVYENEGFRKTLAKFVESYSETFTPSYDTKCKFYNTIFLIKTVGEFGYICVKEPLMDWADNIALNLLEMPADEATSAIIAELLSFLPERTKMAYYRLRGLVSLSLQVPNLTCMTSVAGLSTLSPEEVSSNTRPILSFPNDRSPTQEAFIRDLLSRDLIASLNLQDTPSQMSQQMTADEPTSRMKLEEKPSELNTSSEKLVQSVAKAKDVQQPTANQIFIKQTINNNKIAAQGRTTEEKPKPSLSSLRSRTNSQPTSQPTSWTTAKTTTSTASATAPDAASVLTLNLALSEPSSTPTKNTSTKNLSASFLHGISSRPTTTNQFINSFPCQSDDGGSAEDDSSDEDDSLDED
jgi:hypothetical protein